MLADATNLGNSREQVSYKAHLPPKEPKEPSYRLHIQAQH